MATLSIQNVVNISVAQPPAGLDRYRINNLAIFTKDTPINSAVTASAPGYYLSPSDVADDFGSGSETYTLALAIFSQQPNILSGEGQLIVFPMGGADTLATAMTSALGVAFYNGAIVAAYQPVDGEFTDAVAIAEANRKLLFIPSNLPSVLQGGGLFYNLNASAVRYARCLLCTASAAEARRFAAAYASRGMSVDFTGSNTTSNMNLKDLATITADPGITQAIRNNAESLGVGIYPNLAGLGKVLDSAGAGDYFDNVYNLSAYVLDMQIAVFNVLAQSATKVPQTEPGMAAIKSSIVDVCEQYVRNGFVAPGAWNSPETFGNPTTLRRNIEEAGYYIYSQPVNQQTQPQRAQRIAPLIQVAIKYAGAVNKVNVIVNVNP